jgi:beta-glucosidase
MLELLTNVSNWSCKQLEASLLPSHGGLMQKTAAYTYQFFQFGLALPLATTSTALSGTILLLTKPQNNDPPLVAFAKHPQWDQKPSNEAPPVDIGFASSEFQENGPKEHPNTNWGEYYRKHASKLGLSEKSGDKTPDIWHHPERIIDRLKELGVKNYRFSVSQDKIQPKPGGPVNQSAIEHYRHFCRLLKTNGIEPMVTLHHFTDPKYFSWTRKEDIDGFVQYAKTTANALYEEGVRNIITINEPTVVAFQGWGRGEFPPEKSGDFNGVAEVLENMMRAHVHIYYALKERHPDFQIGIAHDPIRFRPYHKWHPMALVEKPICHYLTEITHTALMRFFLTGSFSLQIPFLVNRTFELSSIMPPSAGKVPEGPKKRKFPIDHFGLQFYSDPCLKLSLTGGGSVTRVPGEKLSALGYRAYPQGLASLLEECRELDVPVHLTEIGFDTALNKDEATGSDSERIAYFEKIFQVVKKAIASGIPVHSLYFWTLIDNLEWSHGWKPRFGFYHFDPKTGAITGRPVKDWLKKQIAKRV